MSDSPNLGPAVGTSCRNLRLVPAAPRDQPDDNPPAQPTVCWGFASIFPSRGRRLTLWVA